MWSDKFWVLRTTFSNNSSTMPELTMLLCSFISHLAVSLAVNTSLLLNSTNVMFSDTHDTPKPYSACIFVLRILTK